MKLGNNYKLRKEKRKKSQKNPLIAQKMIYSNQ